MNASLPNSNTHILSPKQSPTTSFVSHSMISSDAQSSMTASPCSLASYSFTSDGKNSSSTSPTSPSSTCTSFTTSTPIPYENQISIANNQTPTPENSALVCQSAKSPYENLCASQHLSNSNTILKIEEQHMLQQQRQRVPLSPSGIRTTTDYHRKPILLNSFDKTNNTFIPSTTFSSTSNTNNNASTKPVLLPSSTNSSIAGDQSTSDKAQQQQKSKLSVSFSNSVQEFYDGKDDDDEDCTDRDRNNDSETSSDNGYDENGIDKICTGHVTSPIDDSSSYTTTTIKSVVSPEASRNQLRINGSESTKPPSSILRTISTEVQVHVQSNEKGGSVGCSDDDGGDSSCFNGNGNNNNNFDGNSSRTLSNSNHDSHGQTNLMCNNIGMNANEPPCDSNNSKKQTNGILKCRELNELVEIDATMLGCGSTSTNLQNRGESSNKIRCSRNGVDAEKCGTVLTSSAVISSSSLPSPTSVNQDLTQSKGNSNNNINSCKTTTQNDSGNRIAKISPSLSSSSAPTPTTLVAPPTEIVGSGPGNLYPKTMPTSSSSSSVAASSTSFGKVHVSQ